MSKEHNPNSDTCSCNECVSEAEQYYEWKDQQDKISDRVAQLERDYEDAIRVNGTLSKLLDGVNDALKGKPPPLTKYSWHDLPQLAEMLVKERDWCITTMAEIATDFLRDPVPDWEGAGGRKEMYEKLLGCVEVARRLKKETA